MPSGSPAKIRNAGAIFLGAHTPEAIGDYVAGSNHVLPTARSARFSSGLGVLDFMKRTSILKCGPEQLAALGPVGHRARRGRGPRRPRPLGRDPPQPAMTPRESRADNNRLVAVTLDEASIGRSSPDVEHERAIAIYDLIEENSFAPVGHDERPLRAAHRHQGATGWCSTSGAQDGEPVIAHLLSLTPFRRIVKDYFLICDSYYAAIRTATPDQIEAIDMGRRGLHDEGSRILQDALKRKVKVDFDTARRLFTLICVLHWKG